MSRSLDDLSPEAGILAHGFLARCEEVGIDILVTCTYRSPEEQRELYAQGRTKPGRIITWAQPGESLHNRESEDGYPASDAIDVVPIRFGKLVWGTGGNGLDDDPTDDDTDDLELWHRVGTIGKECGFVWGGDWKKKDYPHFQLDRHAVVAV